MVSIGFPASKSLGWITWSSLGLGVQGLGQFTLLAVLARYLSAAEFGVVTASLIVIGVGRVIHTGIAPALVQRNDLRPDHVRSAFALCMLSAIVLVAGMWATAPLVAAFFHMDGLADVMRVLAGLFVCQAPGLVPEALLQREMQLRALALAEVASVLLGYVPLGIGCALCDCGVWSLVAAYVGQALLKSAVLVVARPHERAWWPRRGATRELLYFSGGFTAAGLGNVVASQGDNFVVGRWMSLVQLGYYSRAYQLMAMPAMFLGEVVDRIVFPLMARFQSDRARLCTAYGRAVSLIASVMTPAAAGGIVLAPELVRTVLGPGWSEVVLPFQVLMAGLVFRTGYKISDVLARATGAVYARAWRQAIFAAMIFVGALLGTCWGVSGVATGIVGALGVNYIMMAGLSIRTTGLGWGRFAVLHVRGLLFGGAYGGLVLALAEALRGVSGSPIVVLIGASLASLAVLALALAVAPRRILGGDGIWLLDVITGRAGA